MLSYDKIDVSESIDVNKASTSRECIICHYWYFLNQGFKFQLAVCNGCYDILMMCIDLNSIATLNSYGVDYHCNVNGISKVEL